MGISRKARFFILSYVFLIVLAVPTAVKTVAALVCRDPDSSVSGSRVLRNSAGDTATDKVVVFLHGVNGSGESTWLNKTERTYWPALMNDDPQFSHFDVYVASYPSPFVCSAPDITKTATNLRYDLKNTGDYSQIFIIAHSMGGLVAEQMVTDVENDPITLSKFKAVLFFGSPTQGATVASLASIISDNPQYGEMETQSNGYLYLLGKKWGDLLVVRQDAPHPPHSYCAVESYRTEGVPVVPDYMAQFRCDEHESLPVFGNHIEMVKPSGRNDLVYRNTARLILSLSTNSAPQKQPRLKGHNTLQDCWLDGPHCGFQFSTGKVVGQYAETLSADIVLMNQVDQTKITTDSLAMFFASNDSPPYVGGGNKGANAGIVEMPGKELDEVTEAPLLGYIPHWVPVKVGGVYCVRTRDAVHFAKLKITQLTNKSVDFDWEYQPEASRNFQQ
jgi:pimeloyl-ACP methyl ester carboxylesterase